MGAEQSAIRPGTAVPNEQAANRNESAVFINSVRNFENGGKIFSRYRARPEAVSTADVIEGSAVVYGENRCFGEREALPDGSFGAYKWINYKEVEAKIRSFAAGLRAMGIKRGDAVGIYSHNCAWWQITQFAVHYLGAILVPIYDSLGPGAAKYIVSNSECKLIVAHRIKLANAMEVMKDSQVKSIVLIADSVPVENQNIVTVDYVLKIGQNDPGFVRENLSGSDLAIIMYTSGSTGNPKGCILTHQNILAGGIGLGGMNTSITETDTFFSFLPLAHVYELCCEITLLCQGSAIGFYTGDTRNIVNDMKELRPTVICGVPRIFNRISESFRGKIDALPAYMRIMVDWAIKEKDEAIIAGRGSSLLVDRFLLGDFKNALGGRLRLIVSGGAPILPDVYRLIRATVCQNIIQGYGLTECTAAAAVQQCGELNPMCVGPPAITTEMKLRTVEGMSYDPQGNPPSGEMLFRGPSVFKGYYKNEELTKESLQDGWFASGDVGIVLSCGSIQIVDRVKQLVKLSQGEYVSLTSLSDIYGRAKGVQFIYVYADSHHNEPVAVVIPTDNIVEKWKKEGINNFMESPIAQSEIVSNLKVIADLMKLRGFERITKVILDDFAFTVENNFLTPSLKPRLQPLRAKYEARLIELYNRK